MEPAPTQSRRFGRQRRIRSRADFRAIQATGRRVHTPSFVLLIRAREGDEAPARLGITVSRRVGNAVVRNRIKRVVREAFRHSGALFDAGLDIVVIARPNADRLGSPQVLEEWRSSERRLRKAFEEARGARSRGSGGPDTPPAGRSSPAEGGP